MTERQIFQFLRNAGLTAEGAAGVMGNLYAESGLRFNNLQNTFEKKLGMDDKRYTAAVDSGEYRNFAHDEAGYGIAQWTFWSRKQALFNLAKDRGTSISDPHTQLVHLVAELTTYGELWAILTTTADIELASDLVMKRFERPQDQGEAAVRARRKYSKEIHYRCTRHGAHTPYEVYVRAGNLNIRSGPGTGFESIGKCLTGVSTIVEEADGVGANRWGRLKDGGGWISLDYAEKIS